MPLHATVGCNVGSASVVLTVVLWRDAAEILIFCKLGLGEALPSQGVSLMSRLKGSLSCMQILT